ncbi:MAG TPA: LssY C-terminal domain-containing protein, partial [Bryobacteraceae bacterium]|nr:LssY C-terminal domain-containing protein [Bryobacteraceae bacterium]
GLRHETAGLDLEFSRITLPDGETSFISTQVVAVDNGRERVDRDGRIQGVRSTGSLSYRVTGYIRTALQWEIHAELAEWAIRSLVMELPEPEIYYPAGVELTLTLTEPLSPIYSAAEQGGGRQVTDEERVELTRIAAILPYRTQVPVSGRSSDLTNILFIGSRDQIVTAFDAAGWTQPSPPSFRDRIHWIRAVGELRGDGSAPMSLLLLNGAEPDMSWEKGLNDVSKRHHIRLWKAAGTWHGEEIWVGAATRDVDFAYLRPGRKLSHKIEENVDQERDKVAYDVAFSGCGNILDWTDRADFPRSAHNGTGDSIVTDGRMTVIELNDCRQPRLSTETVDTETLPKHGDLLQRFARREILSARNGLLRANPYWRVFEATRWMVYAIRERKQGTQDPQLLSGSRTAWLDYRQPPN